MLSTVESFEESIKNYVASLLSRNILPCISDYLKKEKNVEITTEELLKALDVKIKECSNVVPPVIKNGSLQRKKKSKFVLDEKPEEGSGLCMYQFIRGHTPGKFCGKPCVQNYNYCSGCKTKGLRKEESLKKKPKKVNKDVGLVTKKKVPEEEVALVVDPYCGIEAHFIHPETNFIILSNDNDNVCFAIAREHENGELYSLTEEEKIEAKKITLITIDDEEKEKEILKMLKENVEKSKETTVIPDPPVLSKVQEVPSL